MNKLIAYIFAALILFGVCAFIVIKLQKPESKPTFLKVDSLTVDSLKTRLDTIKITVTVWKTKVKTIYETDTVIYAGNDTACIEIIERKNKRISALDTLCDALDKEAQTYSELNVVYLKRNTALSDSASSLRVLYNDSLTMQRKYYKKKLFWTNVKWGVFTTLGIVGTVQLGK